MDDDAEFSLVRFKIDKALLTSAEAECERHGFELFEVVRALVAQIVRDQSIPVDMGGYPRKDDRGAPTPACLQMEPLEEQLESETLLDLIATVIARTYGISESVIGLTLVAVGTSLPELATTVMAALRKHADVALGNVIGSNLFNLLTILGITTLIRPIPVDPGFLHFDLWVMLAASLLLIPFVFWRWDMGRGLGAAFCALYAAYIVAVLV